jgi:hypothetical protein
VNLNEIHLANIFLITGLYLFPQQGFSEDTWIPSGLEETIHSVDCKRQEKEISFETKIPIHVECSYPVFAGNSTLIEYVNSQLKKTAEDYFDSSVRDSISSEEEWEDGCSLSYQLFPVHVTSNLISIYGYDFQSRDIHGCTYYIGKNFWQKDNSVVEIGLDDLFIKGSDHRQFLLQYCENYLKASGHGYYSSLPDFLPELDPTDLDIFVLDQQGLMIIFRAYKVSGWADGPSSVLIPYTKLRNYIDPHGPLMIHTSFNL